MTTEQTAPDSSLISHLSSPPPPDAYEVASQPIGQWTLIWARFRRHRLAVIGAWIFLAMIVLAIAGPFFAPPFHFAQPVVPTFTPPRLWPFSLYRLMGLDPSNTGVSTYVLLGGRGTLVIGVLGSVVASLIGCFIGGVAGYFGRFVDSALMRLTDAFLTVPLIPAVAMLSIYLPVSYSQNPAGFNYGRLVDYALLFGLVGWAGVSRLVRGYVLSLRKREFADAARALGASDLGIIFRHLLPNALDVIVVSFTLNIAVFIVALASLGFLVGGFGLGTGVYMWAPGLNIDVILAGAWWIAVFPAIPLLLTVMAVNFLGDGLRDALVAGGESELVKLEGGLERKHGRLVRLAGWGLSRLFSPLRPPSPPGPLARRRARGRSEREEVSVRPTSLPSNSPSPTGGRGGWGVRVPRPAASTPTSRDTWLQQARWRYGAGIVVPLVLLLNAGVAILFGHSPLRYAPHFPAPVAYVPVEGLAEYGAKALPGGGWKLLAPAPSTHLAYLVVDAHGTIRQQETLGAPDSTTPSIAAKAHRTLGVWVSLDGSTIDAGWLGTGSTPFPLVPATGSVEHPYALSVPGGFDILFSWLRGSAFQVYLAFLPDGARHPAFVRQIAHSPLYSFYPRAVLDGSGALDVIWIDQVRPLTWSLRFRRFTVAGRSAASLPLAASSGRSRRRCMCSRRCRRSGRSI